MLVVDGLETFRANDEHRPELRITRDNKIYGAAFHSLKPEVPFSAETMLESFEYLRLVFRD